MSVELGRSFVESVPLHAGVQLWCVGGERAFELKVHPPRAEPEDPHLTTTEFTLAPAPPFRLDLTVWALRRHAANKLDRWDGETYRRALTLSDAVAEVAVHNTGTLVAPRLTVSVVADSPASNARAEVTALLYRMLGLDVNLTDFFRQTEGDNVLSPLVRKWWGFKPPRFPTLFECLVNAVACQQLTLTVGIVLLNRLVETIGAIAPGGGRAFPAPSELADADARLLRDLGFSNAKARYLRDLADRVAQGDLHVDALEQASDSAAMVVLRSVRGIGRWSAEYALLRGLGRHDVFPADDVGARNSLNRLFGFEPPTTTYRGVREAVARWDPYSGLVYFLLLLDRIEETGAFAMPVTPYTQMRSNGSTP